MGNHIYDQINNLYKYDLSLCNHMKQREKGEREEGREREEERDRKKDRTKERERERKSTSNVFLLFNNFFLIICIYREIKCCQNYYFLYGSCMGRYIYFPLLS